MVPKINIKCFDNKLYRIIGSKDLEIIIAYHDLNHQSQNISNNLHTLSSQHNTVNFSIPHKHILIDSIIKINFGYPLINDDINAINIFNYIKDKIDEDFCKKAIILGEKHRKENISFDINLKDIKNDSNCIYRLINSSHYIGRKSRMGPSNFFVSNEKTYDELFKKLKNEPLEYDSHNNILIAQIPFLINKNIENDIILTGRKNDLEFGGLHCVINTDENDNINLIKLNSIANMSGVEYELRYKIIEIGTNAHENYLNINTNSVSYYRRKKLEKIKNSQL